MSFLSVRFLSCFHSKFDPNHLVLSLSLFPLRQTQRKELTKKQIERIDQTVEQIQELLELDQTNQLIADELVSEQLKTSQKAARRNLMRVIVAGLMMENSPVFEQHY